MNKINIDLLLSIWSYVGPNTIYLVPPIERVQIKNMKNRFKENPVCLFYKLIEWKSRVSNIRSRATMRVDKKEKNIFLDGEKPINIMKHGEIEIFGTTKEAIIPRLEIISSTVPDRMYMLVWTLYSCRVENIEQAKLYSTFWNNY